MTLPTLAAELSLHAEAVCQRLLPAGKRVGKTWTIGNIQGAAGDSCIVELEGPKAGFWYDHAESDGGDMLSLVAKAQSITVGQAAKWARDFLGIREEPERQVFSPLRKGFKRQDETEWRYGTTAWHYPHADAYVVRFNLPNGKKDTLPLRFLPPDGVPPDRTNPAHWRWKGWAKPLQPPIYRLPELEANPDAPVLVVEGEKTADAAAKLFPDHVVISWATGASAVDRIDWTPLTGRTLLLWPDNDAPGVRAMTYLKARFPEATLVKPPSTLPEGWDLADPLPEGVTIDGILNPPPTPPAAPEPDIPFRCLGHDEAGFHYLSYRSGRIVTLSAAEHTELNLQLVTGDDFWGRMSARLRPEAEHIDYKAIAKSLIAEQFAAGHYDPDHVRGLGCWIEGSTVVYHAGDKLYVNGKPTALHAHRSPFIYPSRKATRVNLSSPASATESGKLVELSNLLPWAEASWPWVLPAACFIATICGALDWRPHGWLVGSKGSGKTWIYSNFISPILGDAVIKALSTTTEAGIRQVLGADALPVIFDEIESKDERSIARIRNVLELARQSSSETGGSIFKGTASGVAKQFRIRSTFIFSSIVSGATEPADESRIARMELSNVRPPDAPAKFEQLVAIARETLQNPEWCERIRARAIHLAPAIRTSAEVFQRAIAKAAGDARKGQQYGALASGYWHLSTEKPATPAEAVAWASAVDWKDIGVSDNDSDEVRAMDILYQSRIQLQDNDGKRYDHTVEELLYMYFTGDTRGEAARDALVRIGVNPSKGLRAVDIAVRHVELSRIFRGTHFADRWKDHFMRIPGAVSAVSSPKGMKSFRAVRVKHTVAEELPIA